MTDLDLKLMELNCTSEIYAKYHSTDNLLNYDLILDRDILHKLGIVFNFKNNTVTWQEVSIPMKPPNKTVNKYLVIKENLPVQLVTKRIKQILNTKHKKNDLKSIVMDLNYFKDKYKKSLLNSIQKYIEFDIQNCRID